MTEQNISANLEHYKLFYYAARYGSITAAANKLFLTQPSVTKSIQRLEEQLDCKLFTRTKRGVSLTAEGEILWKRIEPAFELMMSAERELEAVKGASGGTLSIAATEMGFGLYVLPALGRYLADYPTTKVKFRNALTGNTVRMLKNGVVDLAILYSPFEPDDELRVRTIDVFRECLIAGSRYAYLAERENDLAALSELPFISMPEGSSGKEYMAACFHKYGLVFEPDIEVTTMELVIQAAANNLGVGTLPQSVVESRVADGSLCRLPVRENLPERQVYVVTSKSVPQSFATQTFIERYLSAAGGEGA